MGPGRRIVGLVISLTHFSFLRRLFTFIRSYKVTGGEPEYNCSGWVATIPLGKMAKEKKGGWHTLVLQKHYMVEWLKEPEQFNIIVGKTVNDRTTSFGGAQTKMSGFGLMAVYVYKSCIQPDLH